MATRIEEIQRLCRFCLRQEGLMDLREALTTGFSVEDVTYHTGISITGKEKLPWSICYQCMGAIKYSANFRRTCLRTDIIFQKILALLMASPRMKVVKNNVKVADSSETIESDSQHSETEATAWSEAKATAVALDSDDSISIVYDNIIQNEKNLTLKSVSSISLPPNHQPALTTNKRPERLRNNNFDSDENAKDVVNGSVLLNKISPDGNTSDDSLPSLYEAVMQTATAVPVDKKNRITSRRKARKKYERDQLCPLCGVLSRNIINHLKRTHRKERQYNCPNCPQKFTESYFLKRHMNTWHDKHVILTCEQCGKGFTNRNSHFYHMKNSHGKSDVYECKTCHRKFKSIDGFRKHLKEHSLTAYPCPHCDKRFKTMTTFEKHEQRYHAS